VPLVREREIVFLEFRQSFGVSLEAETFQNILYLILTPTPFAPEIFCVSKTIQNRKLFKFCGLFGTKWRSRLMHCDTSPKVLASIPSGFTGIFY
jgi:hypothetical protein